MAGNEEIVDGAKITGSQEGNDGDGEGDDLGANVAKEIALRRG